MQVTVEALNGLERKLIITVPAQEIQQEIEKRIKDLAPKVKIAGFRPGKVPASLIRQRFGDSIRSEVISEVVQTNYYKALEQEKIRPTGMPNIEVDPLNDTSLVFKAAVEVYPEIPLNLLHNVEIEKYKVDVSEEAVDEMIDKLIRQHAQWHEVNRVTQKGDRIQIDFEGRIHGETFEGGSGKSVNLELGAGSAIPDFEEQLTGAQPHVPLDFPIRFPNNYPRKELVGKTAMVNAIINQVQEPELPELDEELLQKLGVEKGGVEQLRVVARANMESQLERAIQNHTKQQVIEKLLTLNPLEVPQNLLQSEVDSLKKQAEAYYKKGIGRQTTDAQYRELAERRVRLGLLFGEVIRQRQLKVDPNRVQTLLQSVAAAYSDPQSVIAWYKSDKQQMQQLESAALEDQVIDELTKEAIFVEKNTTFGEATRQPEGEEF